MKNFFQAVFFFYEFKTNYKRKQAKGTTAELAGTMTANPSNTPCNC